MENINRCWPGWRYLHSLRRVFPASHRRCKPMRSAMLSHKSAPAPGFGLGSCRRAARVSLQRRAGFRRWHAPCRASAEAEQLLSSAKQKYEGGDRMGALRLWEQALQESPTRDQRVVALFNAACVHASFGDVELAQIPLKDAIFSGLDFSAAMDQADERFVRLRASTQVLNQLRKFNDQVLRSKAGTPAPPPAFASSSSNRAASAASSKASGGMRGMLSQDVSETIGTDVEGIDASVGGILKRVALLLLALSALGTVLFYVGLRYAFPEGS